VKWIFHRVSEFVRPECRTRNLREFRFPDKAKGDRQEKHPVGAERSR
jgi:hypothetical protein